MVGELTFPTNTRDNKKGKSSMKTHLGPGGEISATKVAVELPKNAGNRNFVGDEPIWDNTLYWLDEQGRRLNILNVVA